jgi:hypothetical protein
MTVHAAIRGAIAAWAKHLPHTWPSLSKLRHRRFPCAFGVAMSIACMPAQAGSPGGLRLAVAFTSAATPYAATVRDFFARYDAGKTLGECEDALLNIESATFGVESKKLGGDAAFAALADRKRRKQIGTVLARYRDKHNGDGLDGLLVVEKAGGQLILYGVSAAAEYPLQTAKTDAASVGQTAKLDLAVCKAIVRLPVMREP